MENLTDEQNKMIEIMKTYGDWTLHAKVDSCSNQLMLWESKL